ncbi:MAG TPA: ankryin, partial [Wolbachia sp.]|nr:ankryin [Wolbachia sp.]
MYAIKYIKTALHCAAENGLKAVVKSLVEKGANITAQDKDKKTALHYAANNGHREIVRFLGDKGVDV